MKLDRPLSPSLTHIEERLFGVSPELIQAVEAGKTSPAIAEAVRRSAQWAARGDVSTLAANELETTPHALPGHLRSLIARRVSARAAVAQTAPSIPMAGQIVVLRQIRTPQAGQLDWIMQVPLFVLLDAPAEDALLWHGWLASGEADYAGWWDFVLQEEDGPLDPAVAIVQLWNPVRVYLPMADHVISQLSPARLQAVRALAAEYLTGAVPADVPPWLGRVAQRALPGGLWAVTGSPLGGDDDPRHLFQHLYFHAAEAVREPARLALAERVSAPVPNTVSSLMARWLAIAGELGSRLRLVPRIEQAMSAQEPDRSNQDLLWEDLARLSVLELAADGAGRAQVSAQSAHPVCCELYVSGVLELKQTAHHGQGPIQIHWDAGETAMLTLSVADGRRLEIPLAEAP